MAALRSGRWAAGLAIACSALAVWDLCRLHTAPVGQSWVAAAAAALAAFELGQP